jgi:uncharacterized protein YkwD
MWPLTVVTAAAPGFPEPEPPFDQRPAANAAVLPQALTAAAASVEWTWHRSDDLQHPNGEEQELLWLVNRARKDPAAEGIWLATETNAEVASSRSFFGVDLVKLQAEFAALDAKPPAAFDARLYAAAKAHSDDLIARDAQDHNNQFDRIDAAGFNYTAARGNVFSFASSSLNGHAAFNTDWGYAADGMQSGREHRKAIMSIDGDYTNTGMASVVDNDPKTIVGERVITQNFARANANGIDHFNRFIVGTVWKDGNTNGRYDAGEGYAGIRVVPDNGTYHAVTSAGGGYAIPVESPGNYQVTFSGSGINPAVTRGVTVAADSVLLDYEISTLSPPGTVDLGGMIENTGGTPLCSMVLASGQFMFSCNPVGKFSLLELPRESNGTVKRQVYADGFFPKIDALPGSVNETVVMTRSGVCPKYSTTYDPGFIPDSAGKRINLSGKVLLQNSQTPICAMVLANGQFMFSCDGTGSYALTIPLDSNGQFKLQVYADGFAPTIQVFDEFQTMNNVRMARAVECQ